MLFRSPSPFSQIYLKTGIVFSGAKLSKGLQAINFISNAKQMFAPRNLFNFAMNIIKNAINWLCRFFDRQRLHW